MTDTYRLWCIVEGDDALFSVVASSTQLISGLRDLIQAEKRNSFEELESSSLGLWKVTVRYL
jgi:hypothetical protein